VGGERRWEVFSTTTDFEWSLEFVFYNPNLINAWKSKLSFGSSPQYER
jgi:hypothetical protein